MLNKTENANQHKAINIVVLENNEIICQALTDFTKPNNIISCKNNDSVNNILKQIYKIHLLIIDDFDLCNQILLDRSYLVINFTSHEIPNSLFYEKPFKLQNLLDKVNILYEKKKIFCIINNGLLYDEEKSILRWYQKIIHLTEKENILLSILIGANDFYQTKEDIKNLIYSPNKVDDFVIDSLALRLRQKLPIPLLSCNNKGYILNIDNIR